jgi:hypothetical protein
MANPDHIAQLMKGVPAWNAWREESHTSVPNFSGANLREAAGRTSTGRTSRLPS